jgi:hypothetical protein
MKPERKALASYGISANPVIRIATTVAPRNEWEKRVAVPDERSPSGLEADRTTTCVTRRPGLPGFEFSARVREGKKVRVVRGGQREYRFTQTGAG